LAAPLAPKPQSCVTAEAVGAGGAGGSAIIAAWRGEGFQAGKAVVVVVTALFS